MTHNNNRAFTLPKEQVGTVGQINVGQALPDNIKRSSSRVWRPAGFEDLPLTHCPSETISGRFPPTTCGNDTNLMGRFLRGFVHRRHPEFISGSRRFHKEEMLKQVQHDNIFYQRGFTLIELLVVVLIIGILAAVAIPQYQKAVERARASEAFPLLKSVCQAAQTYQLANGDWPEKFDELAVEIPWTGNVKWRANSHMTDTRSNQLWSLQLYQETGHGGAVYLGRISGKYEGVGFGLGENGNWKCVEKTAEGKVFSGNEGDYCVKVMRCAETHSTWNNGRYYFSCPF